MFFLKYLLAKIIMKLHLPAVNKSLIHSTAKIQSGSCVNYSSFGRYSYCGRNCNINNAAIGSFCSISHDVNIGGAAHPMEFVSTSPVFLSHGRTSVRKKFAKHVYMPKLETSIGHDVWIGAGVYIKAGVNVGSGAVIGMGSVVTKNVPAYAVVAGNPAKLIKFRFSEKIVLQFLEIEWWNWDESKIMQYGNDFNNPESLFSKVY